MKEIGDGIWQHRGGILCLLLFTLIYVGIFSLYQIEAEPVWYAGLLCACIGLIAIGISYRRYRTKLRKLRHLTVGLDELPPPTGAIEREYQKLLTEMVEKSKKEALERDRARSAMIEYYTLWVHQIKTPIAAMRLMAGTVEFEGELLRMEQYVDMVLSYQRLESESTDYVIRRQALEPIVKGVIHKYAPLFIRKKLSLTVGDLSYMVLTDEKWLGFCIEQIVSNALKYTKSGGISIYMEGQSLVIQDTGIGIAPEDLARIFEKGFTGYNGREEKRATGLGLYLCRRILEKLGHTIHIESQEGQGTKVYIGLDIYEIGTQQ